MKTFKNKKTGKLGYYENGVFNQDNCYVEIGVEPSSEFWEEVIEKDYEILSFYSGVEGNPFGYIFTKQSNGSYSKGTGDCSLEHGLQYWKIYSVKRLFDGEIFSIGDFYKSDLNRKITGIIIRNTQCWLQFDLNYPDYGICLSVASKVKCIFTTEDNVEVFTGGGYWWKKRIRYVLGVFSKFNR